jgi:DNA-binding MarR family transcriptional regulator
MNPQPHPGLLIASARRRIKQAVLERIADRQLTSQQFWMIIAVHEIPGISQVEIAARTRADPPNVSRALSALGDRGLVSAEADPEDRRRTCVRLTPAGRRLARELIPIARELRDAMLAGMSAAEVATLRGSLQRLTANLDALEDRRASQGRS